VNWAYLLRCRDGSLYAGWTNQLQARLAAHNNGTGAKYTRSRRPVALAWACAFAEKSDAMAQEARLKRMTKAQKEALAAAWRAAQGELPHDEA
jgi:predicted GIY-YIG superfamily endonuclease